MTTREVLIEELGEQRVKELDDRALLVLIEWAMLQYQDKRVKNCSAFDVVGLSVQLLAFAKHLLPKEDVSLLMNEVSVFINESK